MQVFKKNTADYIEPLKKEIDYFYKYYEEQNRDKVKAE